MKNIFVFLIASMVRWSWCDEWSLDGDEYTLATVNVTYVDVDDVHDETSEVGKYGTGRVASTSGVLVHIWTSTEGLGNASSHHGCEPGYENRVPSVPWIALVRRGRCNFDDKLEAAFLNNASALVVYNNKDDGLQKMTLRNQYRDKIVSVFITRTKGEELAALVDNGTRIMMQISVGTHYTYRYTNVNRTSVMFVSVSFIILMMVSLAWLVFYYIQRFRYLHAKDRLSRELNSAAEKALSKIPIRIVKINDKEVTDAECCAVCIEPYKATDVVRLLPCRHEFHKLCVDPWLLTHRTCPMCKMDILRHYGYVFTGSQESVVNMGLDIPIITGLRASIRRSFRNSIRRPQRNHAVVLSAPSSPPSPRIGAVAASDAASIASSRRYWSWPRPRSATLESNNRNRSVLPAPSVQPVDSNTTSMIQHDDHSTSGCHPAETENEVVGPDVAVATLSAVQERVLVVDAYCVI